MGVEKKKQSVTLEILKALVPYSQQNLKLVFLPHRFIDDLERITRANKRTVSSTYSRAKNCGLIEIQNGTPSLTRKGWQKLGLLQRPDKLVDFLLVSFDIPENRRNDRYSLRRYLKKHGFRPLQKSLWISRYDYSEDLRLVIAELGIGAYVCLFVAKATYAPSIYQ